MDVAPDPIFQFASGFMAAKHFFMANEVGLFEKLSDGPATLDEPEPGYARSTSDFLRSNPDFRCRTYSGRRTELRIRWPDERCRPISSEA